MLPDRPQGSADGRTAEGCRQVHRDEDRKTKCRGDCQDPTVVQETVLRLNCTPENRADEAEDETRRSGVSHHDGTLKSTVHASQSSSRAVKLRTGSLGRSKWRHLCTAHVPT